MGITKQDIRILEHQLDEIHRLEAQLIRLKRDLLESKPKNPDAIASTVETAFLILSNDTQKWAIPVEQVEEVIEMVAVVSPQKPHEGVVGMINYHGELIALFDLGELSGMGKTPINPENIIVVCIFGESLFALMAKETTDVITVDGGSIKIADEVMPGMLEELGLIQTPELTAAIIDVWSAVLSIQTNPSILKEPPETGTEGSE